MSSPQPTMPALSDRDDRARSALDMTHVTRSFPGVKALDDVELHVVLGEVHGVLGENGAGKSTLMAIASGALAPDEGTVSIGGRVLESLDPAEARRLGLAIVRQEPALLPDLTVAENLYLGVSPDKRPSSGRLQEWATERLSVWGPASDIRPEDRIEQLLPQQRFVLDICRALAEDPMVLVLDEPTEHLLREEVEILFGHVRAHVERGRAVVYISHRINEVKQITDRITVLRNGRTVGTFDTADTTEDRIVSLIIGRDLGSYFPEKPSQRAPEHAPDMQLSEFATRGVESMSLDLWAGQIVGLAGIEGNGQREFIRGLAALQHVSGRVAIGGRDSSAWNKTAAARAKVAFLPGDRHREGILPTLTLRENIAFRSLRRLSRGGWVSPRRENEFSSDIVERYNIKAPSLETPIESLSGGNQQKALFGAALASDPRVFLVDEPTQGIDIGARSEVYSLLRRTADSGAIVIVLSSDAVELAGIADRVLVFSRGQVIEDLTGEEVSERRITAASLNSSAERHRDSAVRTARFTNWLAGDAAPLVILGVLIAVIAGVGVAAQPLFLGAYNIGGILALTAVLALVAFGQLLVLLTAGIDVSAGPVVGLVVNVASFYLIDGATLAQQATGFILMFGVAITVGVVNWALIEFVKLNPLIATLATFMAIQGVSYVLRPSPGGTISSSIIATVTYKVGPIPVAFVIVLVMAIVLGLALKRSRPGMSVRAVGSNDEAARVTGISPRLVRLFAYVGCSLFAALAGILFMAQTGTGDARGGLGLILLSITAAVLGGASLAGGRGSVIGALLGALLIQVINSFTVFLSLSSDWQYYVVGILTIAAVAFYSIARRRAAVGE